jgi:hypothetical protein
VTIESFLKAVFEAPLRIIAEGASVSAEALAAVPVWAHALFSISLGGGLIAMYVWQPQPYPFVQLPHLAIEDNEDDESEDDDGGDG